MRDRQKPEDPQIELYGLGSLVYICRYKEDLPMMFFLLWTMFILFEVKLKDNSYKVQESESVLSIQKMMKSHFVHWIMKSRI